MAIEEKVIQPESVTNAEQPVAETTSQPTQPQAPNLDSVKAEYESQLNALKKQVAEEQEKFKGAKNKLDEVYKKKEIICIFQPHRISRVKNLKFEFSRSFKKADTVILCPIYKASENIKLSFAYEKFAKLIIKNSNVSLIKIENEDSLKKLIKQTGYGEKIYIGMGAGSISNWMRNL